jgi:hypothetical protein
LRTERELKEKSIYEIVGRYDKEIGKVREKACQIQDLMEEMMVATEKGLRAEIDRKVSRVAKEKSDIMLKIRKFDERIEAKVTKDVGSAVHGLRDALADIFRLF